MRSLAHAQAGRYEQLEALVERSAADERPEAATQLALLTSLAAETRAQVQREMDAVCLTQA